MIQSKELQEAAAKASCGKGRRITKGKDTSIYIPSKNRNPMCDKVALSEEAVTVLNKLAAETGQSKRFLASELIIQGAKNIVFYAAACRQCDKVESCPDAVICGDGESDNNE